MDYTHSQPVTTYNTTGLSIHRVLIAHNAHYNSITTLHRRNQYYAVKTITRLTFHDNIRI